MKISTTDRQRLISNNYIFTTKEKIMFRLISVLLGIGIGAVILSTL